MRSYLRLMSRAVLTIAAALSATLAGCGRDAENEAGGPLLPGGAVRTFEVLLEPERYLVRDTAFAGYGSPRDVNYLIVAEDFGGALDAHALARFDIPRSISAPDSAGTSRSDTMPTFTSAVFALYVDSMTVNPTGPVRFELYGLTEDWDPESATWTMRVDTTGAQLPWTEAGGTRGALIDAVTWDPADGDTVFFDVDSATIVAWRDTLDFSRGALVRVADAGERARIGDILMHVDARPSFRPDTIVTTTIRPRGRTFVYDPPIGTVQDAPRIGGVTVWRTYLRLKDRLDTLRVPCPAGPSGCTVPLRELTVNYAGFVLEPVAPPAGFVPEDSLQLIARILIESPSVPLSRSLLAPGPPIGGTPTRIAPERYAGGGDPIELAVTAYFQAVTADTTSNPTLPPTLALVPGVQSGTFGFAAFRPAPRLRLVLSAASELQLR